MSIFKLKKIFGDKVKVFAYEGTRRPWQSEGFPHEEDWYKTVAGWFSYYVTGQEKVVDNGVVYHRIYERYIPGTPLVASYYQAVYATEDVKEEVKKALQ